jgi:hypothetical protein
MALGARGPSARWLIPADRTFTPGRALPRQALRPPQRHVRYDTAGNPVPGPLRTPAAARGQQVWGMSDARQSGWTEHRLGSLQAAQRNGAYLGRPPGCGATRSIAARDPGGAAERSQKPRSVSVLAAKILAAVPSGGQRSADSGNRRPNPVFFIGTRERSYWRKRRTASRLTRSSNHER